MIRSVLIAASILVAVGAAYAQTVCSADFATGEAASSVEASVLYSDARRVAADLCGADTACFDATLTQTVAALHRPQVTALHSGAIQLASR